MEALKYLKDMLIVYEQELQECSANERAIVRDNFLGNIKRLRDRFPDLLYPLYDKNISKEDAKLVFEIVKNKVQHNYIPNILLYKIDIIGKDIIQTPYMVKLRYGWYNVAIMNYLLHIPFVLPIEKTEIYIVGLSSDLSSSEYIEFMRIINKINPKYYNNSFIKTEEQFNLLYNKISEIAEKRKIRYDNYYQFCEKNKNIPEPYIFIFLDSADKKKYEAFHSIGKEDVGIIILEYSKMIQHSSIYFQKPKSLLYGKKIIYNNHGYNALSYFSDGEIEGLSPEYVKKVKDISGKKIDYNDELPITLDYANDSIAKAKKIKKKLERLGVNVTIIDRIDNREGKTLIVRYNEIINIPNLMEACIDYINYEADSVERELQKIKEAKAEFLQRHYQKDFVSIQVPIGSDDSNNVVDFCMDLISHVHAFILGQSGSGKSVLLHNIISSVIYKYAPEDLQLYLLDFKLGGVEFNRYKGVKHVKSLLVDNSDQQITLEILRELRDSMIERGKILRNAGVNNLVEYNRINPSAAMPQILLVVDECHEMFRLGSDVPRIISNEISEIVTKIAKEGRSQGVHLIFATQTLSGTEISNEILNNISDHYLLKCAIVDSERMVERSSDITSKLSTGQIYYHHVDSQITFQGYYIDKDNAELQIQKIKDKAKNHASNGEFYFNGSQLFQLNKNILESGKNQKYPTAYIGKNISIKQNDLSITLKKDFSENILLFGLNEQEQVTRTTMNVFLSLLYNTKCKGIDMDFKVFNCLSNDESIYTEQLEMLESKGLCEIIEGKKDRGCFLKQLAEDVINGTSNNTILLILGQERFRELKMDLDISDDKEQSSNEAFGFGEFNFGSSSSSSSVNTFRKALESILDKGPEIGVHVVMQLDKPSNFLFSDYISSKLVYQKFKHLIMLKSDEAASSQLGLNDNVRLENLSRDLERLRAYYYAEESDTYTLFTPYMESSKEEIVELFNL